MEIQIAVCCQRKSCYSSHQGSNSSKQIFQIMWSIDGVKFYKELQHRRDSHEELEGLCQ